MRRRAFCCGLACLVSACGGSEVRHRYQLRIAAGHPETVELCRTAEASPEMPSAETPGAGAGTPGVATAGAGTPGVATAGAGTLGAGTPGTAAPPCGPYTGAELERGTIAIRLDDIDQTATYTLFTERESIGGISDPGDFLAMVFTNVFGLAGDAMKGLLAGLPPAPKNQSVAAATASLRESLSAHVPADLVAAAAAAATPPAPREVSAEALFQRYLSDQNLADPPEDPAIETVFGMRIDMPAPARLRRWTAERDLAYLDSRSIPLDQIAAHVAVHCRDTGFGPAKNDPIGADVTGGEPWAKSLDRLALSNQRVAAALGFADVSAVSSAIQGTIDLDLQGRVAAAIDAQPRSDAQRDLLLLAMSAQLHEAADVCRHNVLLLLQGSGLGAARRRELESVEAGLAVLLAGTRRARDLFTEFIEPFLVAAVVQTVAGVKSGDRVTFGPMDVQPGTTRLRVVRTRAGTADEDVVRLALRGRSSWLGLGLSVSLGLAFSYSRNGTSDVVEKVDTGGAGPPRRLLLEEQRSTVYEPVALGQIDVLRRGDVAVGPTIGIPLANVAGRQNGLILGVGVRIRSYGHLAAGVELYRTEDLPGPESGREEVVLSEPGSETLTADQLTHQQQAAALVVTFAVAKEFF